ncbi:DUF2569 domain-containing protein [Wenzhouxiangella sp. XN201]|uniref:DUF2569 family protein n=1 Tax=Wenzhouxiangella sp. XN201 TaxID=2710755 RepID=UPI0013C88DBD|nr:DUF2569 family protein [Wenzhouxiangella sp. XN201]NEZ02792.1 DUF2569 domain-containing protein [Wenzhouxiangella sp. XN201]
MDSVATESEESSEAAETSREDEGGSKTSEKSNQARRDQGGGPDQTRTLLNDSGGYTTFSKGSSPESPKKAVEPYKGMGPWLRILCFFLIAWPIIEASNLYNAMQGFDAPQGLQNLAAANYVLLAIKFFIGVALLKDLRQDKRWSTIRLTVFLIWIAWPICTAIEYLVLPPLFVGELMTHENGPLAFAIGSVVISALFTSAWTAYLLQSDRLKATYPESRS